MSKSRSLHESFSFAFTGLREALVSEPNLRIHLAIAVLTILAAVFFKFNPTEWIILAFTIAFVLILELMNTSLEALVDMVSPQVHEKARLAKDVAAAAVLLASLTALVVGLFLFLPKVLALFALTI